MTVRRAGGRHRAPGGGAWCARAPPPGQGARAASLGPAQPSAGRRAHSAKVFTMRGRHMRKRPWWRRTAPLVVIVVLALGAASAAWAVTRSGSSATPAATASTSTSEPFSSPTAAATTLAAPSTSVQSPRIVAVSPPVSAPGSLTYTMAAGTPIKVVASNPCWVEVRLAASGPITHVTTLQAGHGLSLPSPLWMRLGNPANVQVTAGTTALQLPVGPGDLVIQSATPGG